MIGKEFKTLSEIFSDFIRFFLWVKTGFFQLLSLQSSMGGAFSERRPLRKHGGQVSEYKVSERRENDALMTQRLENFFCFGKREALS